MASPNTEPIFKKIPFKAVVSLSNQVIPRNGGDTTSSALLLVQAGENGLIIVNVPLPDSIQGVLGTKALLLGPNESLYAALSQSVSPNGYNITVQGGFY